MFLLTYLLSKETPGKKQEVWYAQGLSEAWKISKIAMRLLLE